MRTAPSRPIRLVALGVAGLLLVAAPAQARDPAGAGVVYRPPVDAPISDPFRAPTHPYGPGNRGIEYATEPGSPVRAIGGGEVVFAGPVAGSLHVTVLHPDGLRSTVSYLDRIEVGVGARVGGGDLVGRAGARTHLGVRADDTYLDPAAVLSAADRGLRLVPTRHPEASVADERAAIDAWLRLERRSTLDRASDWLRGRADDAAVLAHLVSGLDPTAVLVDAAFDLRRRQSAQRGCTPADEPVPAVARRRIVVLVAGLGSTSSTGAIDAVDTGALGYDPADVYRFSYTGGTTPDPTDRRRLPSGHYDALDTQRDLRESAAELQRLVAALAEAEPGVPVDVVAHSQGGLVARAALAVTGPDSSGDLGVVVTIGTPHQGADLANAAAAVQTDRAASAAFAVLDGLAGTGIDPSSPSVGQLAVDSRFVRSLDRQALPDDVMVTSIGGRGDAVVPSVRTHLPGASNVVVNVAGATAHDRLPADPATTREIGLALAGKAPTCESTTDVVLDVAGGRLTATGATTLGAATLVAGLAVPG